MTQPPDQPYQPAQPDRPGQQPTGPGPAYAAPAAYASPRRKPSPLPAEPQDFTRFYRSPRWAPWRGIVLVVVVGIVFFAILNIVVGIGLAIDLVSGRATMDEIFTGTTPMMFAANHVGLALCLPVTMLLHWALSGQRPKWLSSITGGFRWGRVLRATAVALPVWLIYMAVSSFLPADATETVEVGVNSDTWFLLAVVILVTPFQGAAEEYMFRGVGLRAIGSLGPSRRIGPIIAVIVTSLLFCLAHGASDPWLWTYYFLFGVLMSVATWLTGGLELAVVMHVVNNLLSLALLPFMDVSGVFDRSAGTGSPIIMLPLLCGAVTVAVVVWWQKRNGRQPVVPAVAAPGAPAEVTANAGPEGPGPAYAR